MLRAGRNRLSPSDTLSLNKVILIAVLSSGNAQVFAFRNLKKTFAASVKSCVCKKPDGIRVYEKPQHPRHVRWEYE